MLTAHFGMVIRSASLVLECNALHNSLVDILSLSLFHHCPLYLFHHCPANPVRPVVLGSMKLRATSAEPNRPQRMSCKLVVTLLGSIPLLAQGSSKFLNMNRVVIELKDPGPSPFAINPDSLKGCIVTKEALIPSKHLYVPWMTSEGELSLVTLEFAIGFYRQVFDGCSQIGECFAKFVDSVTQGLFPAWMKVDFGWADFLKELDDKPLCFTPPPPTCYIMGLPEDEVLESFPVIEREAESLAGLNLMLELRKFWCERCIHTVSLTTTDGIMRISFPALVQMFKIQAGMRWVRSDTGKLSVWGKRVLAVPFLRNMYVGLDQSNYSHGASYLKSCPFGCYQCRDWAFGVQNVPDPENDLRVNTLLMHNGVRFQNVAAICDRIDEALISPIIAFVRLNLKTLPSAAVAHELHDGAMALIHYLQFCNREAVKVLGLSRGGLFSTETIDLSLPIYEDCESEPGARGYGSSGSSGTMGTSGTSGTSGTMGTLGTSLSVHRNPFLNVTTCDASPVIYIESAEPPICEAPVSDKDVEDMKLLRRLFERGIEQRCPVCSARYKLSDGCTHVVCTECGSHFCHTCNRRFIKAKQPRTVVEFTEALQTGKPSDVLFNFAMMSTWDVLLKYWVRKHGDAVGDLPRHHPRFSSAEPFVLHPSLTQPYSHGHDKMDWEFGECPLYVSSFLSDQNSDDEDEEEEDPLFLHIISPFSMFRFCKAEFEIQLGEYEVVSANPYAILGHMMNRDLGSGQADDDDANTGLGLLFRICNMLFIDLFNSNPMSGSVFAGLLNEGKVWLQENSITRIDQLKEHQLTVETFMAFLHFKINEASLLDHLMYTLYEMSHTHSKVCSSTADVNSDQDTEQLVDCEIARSLVSCSIDVDQAGEIPSYRSVSLTNIIDLGLPLI
jgi:hypothetical protein